VLPVSRASHAPHDRELALASRLVASGRTRGEGAPLSDPLVLASTFLHGGERAYARSEGTPTWEALEALVGSLEGGESVAFASGMAAIAALFDELAPGAEVVLPLDVYQGVVELAQAGEAKGRWRVSRVALENTEAWKRAAATAGMVWLEAPSNPLLTVADVRAIAAAERGRDTRLVVDNTLATSLNLRPLELGADASVQSATKFLGGHSDLLAGVVSAKSAALVESLRRTRTRTGATPGALECLLTLRGARTMALRLERAQASAAVLAARLALHPRVERVRYPGLVSHPTHALAREQLGGFGALISFDVRGGAPEADAVCRNVRLVRHATSFGAVESTLERRGALAGQSHLPPSLVRLGVGIEDVEDLWADLERALGESVG